MVEVGTIRKEGLSACLCCLAADHLIAATAIPSADRERRSPGPPAVIISSASKARSSGDAGFAGEPMNQVGDPGLVLDRDKHDGLVLPDQHNPDDQQRRIDWQVDDVGAEIEDFLEGFRQPTYRGMRFNGVRVATWSFKAGWSGDSRPDAEWLWPKVTSRARLVLVTPFW